MVRIFDHTVGNPNIMYIPFELYGPYMEVIGCYYNHNVPSRPSMQQSAGDQRAHRYHGNNHCGRWYVPKTIYMTICRTWGTIKRENTRFIVYMIIFWVGACIVFTIFIFYAYYMYLIYNIIINVSIIFSCFHTFLIFCLL